jgi:hypothetical protein
MQYLIDTKTILTHFAANYDCDAYGSGTYNNDNCATVADTSDNGGPLAGTGFDVIMLIALALALIFAGLVLLMKKILRREQNADQSRTTVASPVPSRDEQDDL